MTGLAGPKRLCTWIPWLFLFALVAACASTDAQRTRIRVDPSTLFNPNQDNGKQSATLGPLDTVAVALHMAKAEDAIVRGINKQLRAKVQSRRLRPHPWLFSRFIGPSRTPTSDGKLLTTTKMITGHA